MCPAAAGGGPPVQNALVLHEARWTGHDARIQRFKLVLLRRVPRGVVVVQVLQDGRQRVPEELRTPRAITRVRRVYTRGITPELTRDFSEGGDLVLGHMPPDECSRQGQAPFPRSG